MGLSRLNNLRCFSTAAGGCLPLGRSSRAGSPGRIRNSAKLNDATKTMVRTAFSTFLTKYRRLSTALRARRTSSPERPRAPTPSHIRDCPGTLLLERLRNTRPAKGVTTMRRLERSSPSVRRPRKVTRGACRPEKPCHRPISRSEPDVAGSAFSLLAIASGGAQEETGLLPVEQPCPAPILVHDLDDTIERQSIGHSPVTPLAGACSAERVHDALGRGIDRRLEESVHVVVSHRGDVQQVDGGAGYALRRAEGHHELTAAVRGVGPHDGKTKRTALGEAFTLPRAERRVGGQKDDARALTVLDRHEVGDLAPHRHAVHHETAALAEVGERQD